MACACFAGVGGCARLTWGLWVIALREAVVPAKKYLTWAAAAFVAFYMINQPEGAAKSVNSAANGLASAAGSLTTFLGALG